MESDEYTCPFCQAKALVSVQSAAVDSELLECQSCKRVYEIKYGAEGNAKLVPV